VPRVILTGVLRQRASGLGTVAVEGGTARAALRALEACHPPLRGWIVDEQGSLRRHVKLFHGGRSVPLEAPLGPHDELHVVAAFSGG
jgi:hypothetical protein